MLTLVEIYKIWSGVRKSREHCDPVKVLESFWNISLVYKFVICCIYLLVCNGIHFIPSQTNMQLGFCNRWMFQRYLGSLT